MGFRFDPYDPAFDADPFPAYKVLRDEYPCFWSEEAGMWVLSRYDDILNALTNWRTYSSAQGNLIDEFPGRAGSTLGSSDPPRHDRLRALIQSAMTKRALDHVLEPARASVAVHLAEVADKPVFDFVGEIGSKVTVDLLFYLFDMPRDQADEVRDNAVLMVQTDAKTRQKAPEHLAAFQWMADYAERLVQQRKANPGDDLLSNFITAEIDGEKLLDKEVQLTVTTLIMAGIESLSGFFGIGGGFLIVPALVASTSMPIYRAIGTSLIAVAAFGLTTAANYAASDMLDWPLAASFIAGGMVGTMLGAAVARRLSAAKGLLNSVFAGLIVVVAVYMLYRSWMVFQA